MSDRELLELAAKAGDIKGRFIERTHVDGYPAYTCGIGGANSFVLWNPLNDDGDALRLAVKLQLTIANEHVSAGAAYCLRGDEVFPDEFCAESGSSEVIESDYVATRRAIVLASASIGEAMP